MSFLDIILGLLMAWGLYKGASNGLFVELAELIALIAGIYGAIHFSLTVSEFMEKSLEWDQGYVRIVAFLAVFLIIVIIVHMAGKFLTNVVDGAAILGLTNKIAGGLFGALKIAVIMGAILLFFERATASFNIVNKSTKKSSLLYEPVKEVGVFVFSKVLKENPSKVEKQATKELKKAL